MALPYRLLNVFARDADRFSGNPLRVFEDGSRLPDRDMQALARQFNLSETVGSACANLGVWLAAQGDIGRWEISQGTHTGRPSSRALEVDAAGTVRVGGLVREVGSGMISW